MNQNDDRMKIDHSDDPAHSQSPPYDSEYISQLLDIIKALRESEIKYRTVIENMQDGIFIAQDMIIQFVNKPYATILGYEPQEIIGRPISDFIAAEDLQLVMERHTIRMSGGVVPNQYDFHLQHRDGVSTVLVSMNVSTFIYQGSIAAIGTIRDVHEQRRAEKALKESEERYRTIFENTGTAMVIIEKDTTISLANTQFQRLSGYSREEIEGKKSWTDFVALEDLEKMKQQHKIRRESNKEALNSYEFRFLSRYGELHHIMLTVDIIPGSTQSVASLLDITDRKQMEESLHQVDTRMKLMSSITRHDIRNKVTVLSGYLALMEDIGVNSEISELMNAMKDTISSIHKQIEFSKIYQDLGVRKPEWIIINDILTQLSIPPLISFTIDLPKLEIYADPMLEKVFENLLDNSIRHGGKVHAIRVSARQSDGDLQILWEDDGTGIPESEKILIFERGYGKNTGLGLYLIENILGITGLKIRERGRYGKGASFEIKLLSWLLSRNKN